MVHTPFHSLWPTTPSQAALAELRVAKHPGIAGHTTLHATNTSRMRHSARDGASGARPFDWTVVRGPTSRPVRRRRVVPTSASDVASVDAYRIACVAVEIKTPNQHLRTQAKTTLQAWHPSCFVLLASISATDRTDASVERGSWQRQDRNSCLDEVARLTESA